MRDDRSGPDPRRRDRRGAAGEPFAARHLIDGDWRDSADGATFDRVSPAHGVLVTRAAKGGAAETEAAIAAARAAFDDGRWSELSRQGARDAAAARSPT